MHNKYYEATPLTLIFIMVTWKKNQFGGRKVAGQATMLDRPLGSVRTTGRPAQ